MIDRRAYDAVLLDAGGVLVHPHWPMVAELLRARGIPLDLAAMDMAEHRAIAELDDAAIIAATNDRERSDRFFGHVLVAGGAPTNRLAEGIAVLHTLRDEGRLWSFVHDDVPAALERIAALGMKLGVVSNANGTVRERLRLLGLGHHFPIVVDSDEERIEKPDPRVFLPALRALDVTPARALYVGDLFHIDVVGARAAGLGAVLLDRMGLRAHREVVRIASLTELAELLAAP